MRICQAIGSFHGGGAQRLALNLALGIHSLGHMSFALAVRNRGSFAEKVETRLPITELKAESSFAGRVKSIFQIREFLSSHNIDVVHVHGTNSLKLFYVALLGMKRPPRLAFTWHDSVSVGPPDGLRGAISRLALRSCDVVFASSNDVAQRLANSIGRDRVPVIANGVPTLAPTKSIDDRIPHLVWAGRFEPGKAPLQLVEAVSVLRQLGREVRVTMAGRAVGSTHCFDEVMRRVQELGLAQVIRFPGQVHDIPELLRGASIGVQTSQSEGLSMALLEQMMAGLAIVATDVGDTANALDGGRCGLLVNSGDTHGLIRALDVLISDRNLRSVLGARARERAQEKYSLQALARQAIHHYCDV
jgi:glycosyltransferase involved in cell wall biosynthesis